MTITGFHPPRADGIASKSVPSLCCGTGILTVTLARPRRTIRESTRRNETPDGRPYDNNYCWVFTIRDGLIREVREYMDTQLVTETFADDTP